MLFRIYSQQLVPLLLILLFLVDAFPIGIQFKEIFFILNPHQLIHFHLIFLNSVPDLFYHLFLLVSEYLRYFLSNHLLAHQHTVTPGVGRLRVG